MKKALTIGFFDGVHLGHQALLRRLSEYPHSTVLTFSNHPRQIICPPAPLLILSLQEKIKLLESFIDEVIVLPFTQELSETPFDQLLDQFELSHLILGAGSVFGKDRQGNEENVRKYAEKRKIIVEYFPKILFEDEPISSSRVRKALEEENIHLATQLLGRTP